MKAIILAAGYATRLYPLTIDKPKALLPIADKPLMEYLLDQIVTIDAIDAIYVVTNHRFADQFEAWKKNACYPLPIEIIDDGTNSDADKLGALGDFQLVLDQAHIDDDVLLAASDNFFTFALTDFYADYARHGKDLLLATRMTDAELIQQMGVAVLDAEGRVLEMVEKSKTPPSDTAVYAVYIYRRDTLPLLKDYLSSGNSPDAPGHFPSWLAKQRDIRAYRFEGECVDIGTPDNYAAICARFGG